MKVLFSILTAGLLAVTCLGQDTTTYEDAMTPLDLEKPEVRFSFKPGVWFVRLRGHNTLGEGATELKFNMDDDQDLSENESSFHGEIEYHYDDWSMWLSAFDFSTDSVVPAKGGFTLGSITAVTGDTLVSSMDVSSFSAEIGYTFKPLSTETAELRVAPVLGLRHIDIDYDIQAPLITGTPRESRSPSDVAAYGGARLAIQFHPTITLNAYLGLGTTFSSGGHMIQVGADLTWHPYPNIGVFAGYRMFEAYVEDDDDYKFDGQLAGLIVGVSIQF